LGDDVGKLRTIVGQQILYPSSRVFELHI
jgi:hypothetical protein